MPGISNTSRPAVLRLPVPCDLTQVRNAAQLAHQFLAEHDCGSDLLMACELALVEGCNNAIQYAPDNETRARPVAIEISCDAERIEMRVTDHTRGFDWPQTAALPDPESEHGRGLYLMQSLMDEVEYLHGAAENILVLRKNRPAESVPFLLQSREEELARGIQQSLLPRELPEVRGFEIAMFNRSAQRIGGDLCDVLPAGDGALLVIADVMGKGVLAAMFAAILRTALRALGGADRPAWLLTQANRLLYEELSGADLFITVQAAFLDPNNRTLTIANAGHCPLLLTGAGAGEMQSISPDGMPLGISPDIQYAAEVVQLPERCRALLYTDGLTEALNAKGRRFGQDRLESWFGQASAGPGAAEELKRDLGDALGEFQAKTVLNDDQTFLIISSNDGYSNSGRGR